MLAKQQSPTQLGFYAFSKLYSDEARPAKPIWLMVSLLLLKHIRNISDESVVEQWSENCYYQYLVGEKVFACGVPCQASDLVYFRNRIWNRRNRINFKRKHPHQWQRLGAKRSND